MNRHKYLKLANKYYLDLDTNKIITESCRKAPYLIEYPWYFGCSYNNESVGGFTRDDEGNLVSTYNQNMLVNSLKLPFLRISKFGNGDIELEFLETRVKERHIIRINEFLDRVYVRYGNNKHMERVTNITYTISFDGKSSEFIVVPNNYIMAPIGYLIQGSPEPQVPQSRKLIFNKGLRSKPFNIRYNEKALKGTCNAFVYNCWAILLKDDLSFDALVLLNAYNKDTLSVAKFIYTTNPYIIKFIMLNRNS